jgi:hypothetical protein
MPSPYEKLSKACLSEWFTISSELKPNYKHVVELDTTVKPNKETIHALEEYLELCDFFIAMLQEMKQIGQSLSTSIVQPILRGMIKSSAL